jgi:hypothetical protein
MKAHGTSCSSAEVAAIAEHEHIPEIAAAALASRLTKRARGGEIIRTMIIDDIHKALGLWRCGIFWNVARRID